jgi:glycosyltransferase involved in cell wall biosynthesis
VAGSPLLSDDHCFGTTSRWQVLSQTLNFSAYFRLRAVLREFQPDVVHIRMFMWQLSPLILPLLKSFPCLYQTAVYKAICPLGTKVLPDGSACSFSPGKACLRSGCLTRQTWVVLMLQRWLWQRWRHCLDLVVALSHGMKRQLAAEGIEPIEVVYNGVPERPMRSPFTNPPTVAYAGRLVPEKGVEVLLRAIARVVVPIPQVRLLIAGQGPDHDRLRHLADQLGIGDRITWLGHLPRAEMERCFETAWVQVVPSCWEEPFGNVSTEAMMRGTAVIASRVGAQPEILQDELTGFLVNPGDQVDLAERLLTILSSVTVAETMGQAGRQRAMQEFSEARRTDRFLDLYHQLRQRYRSTAPIAPLQVSL